MYFMLPYRADPAAETGKKNKSIVRVGDAVLVKMKGSRNLPVLRLVVGISGYEIVRGGPRRIRRNYSFIKRRPSWCGSLFTCLADCEVEMTKVDISPEAKWELLVRELSRCKDTQGRAHGGSQDVYVSLDNLIEELSSVVVDCYMPPAAAKRLAY